MYLNLTKDKQALFRVTWWELLGSISSWIQKFLITQISFTESVEVCQSILLREWMRFSWKVRRWYTLHHQEKRLSRRWEALWSKNKKFRVSA